MNPDTLAVVHENYQDLYRFAYRLLGQREGAEDIVQEAFLRLVREPAGKRTGVLARKWLFVVCRNLCISRLRVQNSRQDVPVDCIAEACSPNPGPGECLYQREREAEIAAAIQALSPKLREVLILREFESMSYEEIAETVGCPVGTVRSRLAFARNEVRDRLRPILEKMP